jgi:hypothetical protein
MLFCHRFYLTYTFSKYLTKEALEGFGDFRIKGQVIRTMKYTDDLVLLAVHLGGLVVSVLANGPKVRGFDPPTEVDGFLRMIKIQSTTSFGGEVKPSVP